MSATTRSSLRYPMPALSPFCPAVGWDFSGPLPLGMLSDRLAQARGRPQFGPPQSPGFGSDHPVTLPKSALLDGWEGRVWCGPLGVARVAGCTYPEALLRLALINPDYALKPDGWCRVCTPYGLGTVTQNVPNIRSTAWGDLVNACGLVSGIVSNAVGRLPSYRTWTVSDWLRSAPDGTYMVRVTNHFAILVVERGRARVWDTVQDGSPLGITQRRVLVSRRTRITHALLVTLGHDTQGLDGPDVHRYTY